jgi:hypothetical protein
LKIILAFILARGYAPQALTEGEDIVDPGCIGKPYTPAQILKQLRYTPRRQRRVEAAPSRPLSPGRHVLPAPHCLPASWPLVARR